MTSFDLVDTHHTRSESPSDQIQTSTIYAMERQETNVSAMKKQKGSPLPTRNSDRVDYAEGRTGVTGGIAGVMPQTIEQSPLLAAEPALSLPGQQVLTRLGRVANKLTDQEVETLALITWLAACAGDQWL